MRVLILFISLGLATVMVSAYFLGDEGLIAYLQVKDEQSRKEKVIAHILQKHKKLEELLENKSFSCPGDPICDYGFGREVFQKTQSFHQCEKAQYKVVLDRFQENVKVVSSSGAQQLDLVRLMAIDKSPLYFKVTIEGACATGAEFLLAMNCVATPINYESLKDCVQGVIYPEGAILLSKKVMAEQEQKRSEAEAASNKMKTEERREAEEKYKKEHLEEIQRLGANPYELESAKKDHPKLLQINGDVAKLWTGKTAVLKNGDIWIDWRAITKSEGFIRGFQFSPGLRYLFVSIVVGTHEDWGVYENEQPPQVDTVAVFVYDLKTKNLVRAFENVVCGVSVPGWKDSHSLYFAYDDCGVAGPMMLLDLEQNRVSEVEDYPQFAPQQKERQVLN